MRFITQSVIAVYREISSGTDLMDGRRRVIL